MAIAIVADAGGSEVKIADISDTATADVRDIARQLALLQRLAGGGQELPTRNRK